MTKSGLADSPFFAAPPRKSEIATPPPPNEIESQATGEDVVSLPHSSANQKGETTNVQDQYQNNQDQKRSFERTNERSNDRSIERLNERPPKLEREKIRHTFDIYKDQLVELQRIQWEKVQAGKKKPKLGKMVSDGIDLYIKQQGSKKNRA